MMYWHFGADVKAAEGSGGRSLEGACQPRGTRRGEDGGEEKEQREEEAEVEGCYKYSGEIWETVQEIGRAHV